MVVRISDKTQNYSKVTKLLVKPKLIKELQENLARGGTSGGIVCWCEK